MTAFCSVGASSHVIPTEKRNYKNPILPDPKTAFGNYENSGLRQSDKNGIIRFKLSRHLSNMVNMVFGGCVRRVDSLSK